MLRPSLRVIVFPSDDEVLSREVRDVVSRLPDGIPDDVARAAIERELRQWYRSLTVHERDTFGAYPDDPTAVWYIYRDGRVRRPNAALERLYTAMAAARTTYADSERALTDALNAAKSAGFSETSGPTSGFAPVVARRTASRR